jgi:ABC-type branched-subunit amino acid transport system ATPase component
VNLLVVSGLVKRFGGLAATDGVDLGVRDDELHAVIGPNGAGKTTLINQLSGELTPDAGTIEFAGRDITLMPVHARALAGISRSYQITSVFPEFTAQQNVMLAAQAHDGHSFRFWHSAARDPLMVATARKALEEVGSAASCRDGSGPRWPTGERRQLENRHDARPPAEAALARRADGRNEPARIRGDGRAAVAAEGARTASCWSSTTWTRCSRWPTGSRCWSTAGVIASGNPDFIRGNSEVREAYLGDETITA